MGKEKAPRKAGGAREPQLTPASEAARRARAAKLADALRANLGRRKADLAQRQEGALDQAETGNRAKRR
ncbi:MAG: hypothetical protein ACHQRJ_15940 [Alphaproteobacteria bacterium]